MEELPARTLTAAVGGRDSNSGVADRVKVAPEKEAMACEKGNLNAARHAAIGDIALGRLPWLGTLMGNLAPSDAG